jgi:hypothetical protein
MIPPLHHPAWLQLVSGEKKLASANVGVNMLIFNSILKYRRDASPAMVKSLVSHAHGFFEKYECTLQAEIQQLLAK